VVDFLFVIQLRHYKWKSVELGVFKAVGRFECRFHREGGYAYQPLSVSEYQSYCPFVWYQNICSASFSFVTVHMCDGRTDRRTNRQNYDSRDHASIDACSVKTN